ALCYGRQGQGRAGLSDPGNDAGQDHPYEAAESGDGLAGATSGGCRLSVIPLGTIPVGVLVERSKSASPWADFHWRPSGVLTGVPDTPPWTKVSEDGDRATFYVGATDIELHRTETANYRDNLRLETPLLWIILSPVEDDPPYKLASVTADPAEGE